MSITAIILAAGSSSRLGRPKQTLLLGGETLLQRAVRVAEDAALSPIVVVVREGIAAPTNAIAVVNAEAAEGMASSVRYGVEHAQAWGCEGAVLMTCDQVGLRTEHVRALCGHPHRIMASAYAGKHGVPAYFPASSFAALKALQGDAGARSLLIDADAAVCEDLALDIDTEADYAKALTLFAANKASE